MLHNQYFLASLLFLTFMNTFINNFKIQERICYNCHPPTPCRWVVIKESQMSLACRQCYVNKNSDNQGAQIYTIDSFYANFRNLVTEYKEELNKTSQFNLKKVIQEKKDEFEQKQFRFIEELTHKLNEIKDSFFMHLDMCQSTYQKEADAHQTYLSERKEIIEYLGEFSENPQLLKLKLVISNETGLNEFYSQLIRLKVLKQHSKNEKYQSFLSNVSNSLNSKLKQNLFIFSKMQQQFNQIISSNCTKKVELPIQPQLKLKSYSNLKTQRTNQSSQNISRNYSPRSRISSQSFSLNLPIK